MQSKERKAADTSEKHSHSQEMLWVFSKDPKPSFPYFAQNPKQNTYQVVVHLSDPDGSRDIAPPGLRHQTGDYASDGNETCPKHKKTFKTPKV